ncbi:MAG: twin-arginine translocation signal domain-containing protein, partial [Gemmatimonadaceae bacterium]
MDSSSSYSRRDLLKQVGLGGVAAAVVAGLEPSVADALAPARSAPTMIGVPFEKRDTVRIAIVGTGLRG